MQLVKHFQDDYENQKSTVYRDGQHEWKPIWPVEHVGSQSVNNQHAWRARETKDAVSYTLALVEGPNWFGHHGALALVHDSNTPKNSYERYFLDHTSLADL